MKGRRREGGRADTMQRVKRGREDVHGTSGRAGKLGGVASERARGRVWGRQMLARKGGRPGRGEQNTIKKGRR